MCTVCTYTWGTTTLEAPPPGKIVMPNFVIEAWLKCIETTTTTKKVLRFYGENVEAPPKQCTLWRDRLIRPCIRHSGVFEVIRWNDVQVVHLPSFSFSAAEACQSTTDGCFAWRKRRQVQQAASRHMMKIEGVGRTVDGYQRSLSAPT